MFIRDYCWIEHTTTGSWIPFRLWDNQIIAVKALQRHRQVVILKARQLGLTWLVICYALHRLLFDPGAGVLIFSRRDDEAAELLQRLYNVNARLPEAIRGKVTTFNAHEIRFGEKGSWARAFTTTKHSGRTYTATLAIIDEADFIFWLKRLLNAVKPTIDAGGQLCLISTVDKENRNSEFKRIWNDAENERNNYRAVFIPWSARPDRDAAWYQRQVQDYEEDDLWQEYPATPEEALAARKASKRFSPAWLTNCRGAYLGSSASVLDLPGSTLFIRPQVGQRFLVAADPAEGNPGGDFSAATVFNTETWEQAAVLQGLLEPDVFAHSLVRMAKFFNKAEIVVERNNHGQTVLLALEYAGWGAVYTSPFDGKPGWLTNTRTKVLAVDNAAIVLRESACRINDLGTLEQLAQFNASTLAAPEGEHDDLAMAAIIGLAALRWPSANQGRGEGLSYVIEGRDPLLDLSF
jgi:hypothetical protein